MDYPCAKFGDFSFSRFGFIVLTDRQLDRQTDRQTGSHTDADDCYTHATPFGASNEWFFSAGDCVPAKGLVHVTLGYLSCKKQLLAVCQFTVCVSSISSCGRYTGSAFGPSRVAASPRTSSVLSLLEKVNYAVYAYVCYV